MTRVQKAVLTLVPAEWEFVPLNSKAVTGTLLSRLRASRDVEFRYMPDPALPKRRLMQWRRRPT